MGLQIARYLRAGLVIGTSTSPQRRERLKEFGADLTIDTRAPDWVAQVLEATGGKGVDLLIDLLAGPLTNGNLAATRIGGRIVNVGRMAGETGEFNFDLHSMRRITYVGVTFRTRSAAQVEAINEKVTRALLPALCARRPAAADRQGVAPGTSVRGVRTHGAQPAFRQDRAGKRLSGNVKSGAEGSAAATRNSNLRNKRMARLPLIDPAATSGDMRASFDRMPVVLNIFRMMAHAEANFIPAMRFANSILHRQKLSHVNRELLILQVAQWEHGAYEWRQHVPIALGVGVTQKQIDCIEQGKYEDAAFNAAEQALLAFGREVIENVRVAEPVFAAMRKHFSEQEIVESILAIGFYMTMARLTEATDVDLDPAAGMTVFEGGKKRSG